MRVSSQGHGQAGRVSVLKSRRHWVYSSTVLPPSISTRSPRASFTGLQGGSVAEKWPFASASCVKVPSWRRCSQRSSYLSAMVLDVASQQDWRVLACRCKHLGRAGLRHVKYMAAKPKAMGSRGGEAQRANGVGKIWQAGGEKQYGPDG